MAVEVSVGEYYELMLYLSGGYDFNTSEDVIIKLHSNIGFSTVGDVIEYKRTFPGASMTDGGVFTYKNNLNGKLIFDLNGYTIEGIYSKIAVSIFNFNTVFTVLHLVKNGSFAFDIQNTVFNVVYGTSKLNLNRVNIALNCNNTNVSSFYRYVKIIECQLLLTGSINNILPGYYYSTDNLLKDSDGLLIFCDDLVLNYDNILVKDRTNSRIGVVGTIICSRSIMNLFYRIDSNGINPSLNIFVDLTIKNDFVSTFNVSDSEIGLSNSIVIARLVKGNGVDLCDTLISVNNNIYAGNNTFCNLVFGGNISLFKDEFIPDRKVRLFSNNYISPDLYSSTYILNVLGFQTYENL